MAKKGQRQRKYSPEFKLSVIIDMRTNHLSYSETIKKYNLLVSSRGGAKQTVQRWERKYLEEGELGLMKDNRGRPTAGGKKRGGPPKLNKQVEQDLIVENQRLKEDLEYARMEIAYLKKLDALVQAREQKNGKKHK